MACSKDSLMRQLERRDGGTQCQFIMSSARNLHAPDLAGKNLQRPKCRKGSASAELGCDIIGGFLQNSISQIPIDLLIAQASSVASRVAFRQRLHGRSTSAGRRDGEPRTLIPIWPHMKPCASSSIDPVAVALLSVRPHGHSGGSQYGLTHYICRESTSISQYFFSTL